MNNIPQMLQMLRANPMQMLSKRFNIPQNINDPKQMIQHLLNSGQITQAQLNQAMQIKENFKGMF